ncbi:MAG: response regulator transcription factor [Clostridia bacterium]|nr:response regulator transcription factor [Clostridia bacterium]
MRALIVEDDKALARTLGEMLSSARFECDISNDGESGLDNGLSGAYDLIVLDIMLPKKDGFSIARELRKQKIAAPILMLTARTETNDKVRGLDSGADYYLTKPFEMSELLACVRALTRRQGEVIMDELSFGDIRLNLSTCDLGCGEKKVRLGKKEFSIMHILMSNGGAIVSKETLLNKVWGCESDAEDNNVEVYISFLRKKLSFLKATVQIATLRKFGYRLEAQA